MDVISFEEFKQRILDTVKTCPKNWRFGQSVFNVVDELFGVARYVQFVDKIDCFYNDDVVDDFLLHSYIAYYGTQDKTGIDENSQNKDTVI